MHFLPEAFNKQVLYIIFHCDPWQNRYCLLKFAKLNTGPNETDTVPNTHPIRASTKGLTVILLRLGQLCRTPRFTITCNLFIPQAVPLGTKYTKQRVGIAAGLLNLSDATKQIGVLSTQVIRHYYKQDMKRRDMLDIISK